jgi:transcriptional regulator with XRE-family HTH domain
MATTEPRTAETEIIWTPSLIRRLRGKRTQAEFGNLLGVPKNTVWRWEAGRSAPDRERTRLLARLAAAERFLEDWKLVGSLKLSGSLEEGSRVIRDKLMRSLLRSARKLSG